ncbi:hypothetical protein FKM82_026288 [Ascaphus truei]
MCEVNQTAITDIWLLGFQTPHIFRIPLFFLFLIIYTVTLTGNLIIIVVVSATRTFNSPMYFFLCHLSLSDILLTTSLAPNILKLALGEGYTMSLTCCITQLQLFGTSIATECSLLTVMSYDRYLAICNPLRYISIMDRRLQYFLVMWSWWLGFTFSFLSIVLICNLDFCGSNVINHFFCDPAALLRLSISDTSIVEGVIFIESIPVILFQFVFIIVTYVCICLTIFRIPSTTGRQKAFSTCSSHLTVVSTFYGTLMTNFITPYRGQSVNKAISLLYIVGTPLVNPIIYSLRNQEIRTILRKHIRPKSRGKNES